MLDLLPFFLAILSVQVDVHKQYCGYKEWIHDSSSFVV